MVLAMWFARREKMGELSSAADMCLLPEVVGLGSMAYQVKVYIRALLCCFNCQWYGHIGSFCQGKQR